MTEEGVRRGSSAEALAGGPGAAYQLTFGVMSDLLDKLKLLDYETHFCQPNNTNPFSRHYFCLPTNASEQFYAFSCLVAWLLSLIGRPFEVPQEFDDPNVSVAQIVAELKDVGFEGDLPRHKLKQGCGEHVLYALDSLADKALLATKFRWRKPTIVEEEVAEEEILDERAELTASQMEEEIVENVADEEEGEGLDFEGGAGAAGNAGDGPGKPDDVLEATRDAAEWRLEVERVLPLLKVHVRLDNKDWRGHVEQMQVHRTDIEKAMSDTHERLDKLHSEITRTLDKIGSREKYINQQLGHEIEEYRVAQDKLAEVQQKYKGSSGSVTELSKELGDVNEDLESVKAKMDERGTNIMDSGPLVKIKQSLQRLKAENMQMDLRLGVLEHGLNVAKMRNRLDMQKDMNAPLGQGRYAKFEF